MKARTLPVADALDALVRSYLTGHLVEFNYSKIRSKGTPLKTSGGKAPGHVPLRRALENVRRISTKSPELKPSSPVDSKIIEDSLQEVTPNR